MIRYRTIDAGSIRVRGVVVVLCRLRFFHIGERFYKTFPKFRNIGVSVSRYGGVLSLLAEFSRSENHQALRESNFTHFLNKSTKI